VDIRKLEVFCKVYELRSFSRAGDETYLSQPTVSGHIKSLEDHLECRLFDRLGKEIVPTRAGDILYEYAVKIIQLRDETERAINLFQGKLKGRLLIGGSTIPGDYILPALLGQFREIYPDVVTSLKVADTKQVIDMILDAQVEVGMVGARVEHPSIIYQMFQEDHLILAAAYGHPLSRKGPLTPTDLPRVPFVLREYGSGTRMAIEQALRELSLSLKNFNIVAEMGSTQAVKETLKAGAGVSLLSRRAVEDDLRFNFLVEIPVEGLNIKRHFYLIAHRSRTMSPICEAFWKFCTGVGDKD
jgi:DNA-binding transcriptional LysR family regulator